MTERVSNGEVRSIALQVKESHPLWARVCDDLLDARQRIAELGREVIAWRAAVQRITPGGSELMDPASTEAWAQKQNRELGEAEVNAAKVIQAQRKAEQRIVELERERDEATPVLEATREQAEFGKVMSLHRAEPGSPIFDVWARSARNTEEAIRAHDAARAGGEEK